MTPKEKAENLIEKFIPNTRIWNDEKGWEDCIESAKKCALIAVDEIINSSPSLPIISDAGSFVNDIEESTEFWQEVKEELLNMK